MRFPSRANVSRQPGGYDRGMVPSVNDANQLQLWYRSEAQALPWTGPIWDVHTHLVDPEAAAECMKVAALFGVEKIWTMTPLEQVDELRDRWGDRLVFITVPDHRHRDDPETFGAGYGRRIEAYAEKGAAVCKFFASPRGCAAHEKLRLDHPEQRANMRVARDAGMAFMTHIADPDTWFATHYRDRRRYGTKREQYPALERALDDFADVPWIAAHMGGHPEDLDHLQELLDKHPNLHLDTSATKWQVRALSEHPDELRDFCRHNAGRVLFGSDIVAAPEKASFDFFASRYWALRTLLETDYEGRSPIVDPDLPLMDPSLPPNATARLRGARLDAPTLDAVYHRAAKRFLARVRSTPGRTDAPAAARPAEPAAVV